MHHTKSKLSAQTPHQDHHEIACCSACNVNAVSGTITTKRSNRATIRTQKSPAFALSADEAPNSGGSAPEGRSGCTDANRPIRSTGADNRPGLGSQSGAA